MLRSLQSQARSLLKFITLPLLVGAESPVEESVKLALTVVFTNDQTLLGKHELLEGESSSRRYVMPMLINGKERKAIVDTASSGMSTYYDLRVKDYLGSNALGGLAQRENICLPSADGEVSDRQKVQRCISMTITEMRRPHNNSDVTNADGILGLGFNSFARFHSKTFALLLAHPSYGPSAPSHITFGGYSSESCDGRIQWIKMMASRTLDVWQGGIRQILLSHDNQWPAKPLSTKSPVCQDTREGNLCEAAVDSAFGSIAGPASYIEHLLDALQIDPSCKNFDSLPAVFLELAGDITTSLTYTPVYLQLTRFEYISRQPQGRSWTCTPLFQTRPSDAKPPWLLGQPLLHRYYSIFDASLKRIGFALQRRPQLVQVKQGASSAVAGACHDDEVEMAAWSLPNCAKFAEYGYCKHHKRVAARSCPSTCALCKGGNRRKSREETSAFVQGQGLRVAASSSRHIRVDDEI